MSQELTVHDALIFVMVTMSAVDRKMTDAELGRIGDIVNQLPVFLDYESNELVKTAEACGAYLSEDGGLDRVLDLVNDTLPAELRETAYALAVEVAAADLDIGQEELRFLELLQERLSLDNLATSAIERGARARHMAV